MLPKRLFTRAGTVRSIGPAGVKLIDAVEQPTVTKTARSTKRVTVVIMPVVNGNPTSRHRRGRIALRGLTCVAASTEPSWRSERAGIGFDEVAKQWLDLHSKPNLRSHEDNAERYRNHVEPFFGDCPLSAVTPTRILELRAKVEAHMVTRKRVDAAGGIALGREKDRAPHRESDHGAGPIHPSLRGRERPPCGVADGSPWTRQAHVAGRESEARPADRARR